LKVDRNKERYSFPMRIAVIGQGYVGLTISAGAIAAGHQVIGYDLNERVIKSLQAGKSHIEGIADSQIAAGLATKKFSPTTIEADIAGADAVVIAVPTPLNDGGKPDLTALEAVSKMLAKVLQEPTLIINESTSFPGTLRDVIQPLVGAGRVEHRYAISPERVDPGNKNFGVKNTPRIVGGLTPRALDEAVDFYRSFSDHVIPVSSPEVAEAAKLFENTFRFINIGLVNEFAQILAKMGIPVDETLAAAGSKPYGFMPFHPNVGIGGHCIPVDPFYLEEKAKEFGISSKYIGVSDQINKSMPDFVIDRLVEELGQSVADLAIQVIGVAYKADVADTRESPAERVIEILRERGAKVSWHDPLVPQWQGETSAPLKSGADIALVLVAHSDLDMSLWSGGAIYSVNKNEKYPHWIPLISVKSKF
jgi:UDP-N-acetyl-D-glucosamine dehydrogenase